ncbi:MAG: TIGR03013 family XrtA/PEP-CTERM system glycosyltransferase [Acidobacteriota bacterium]
MFSGSYGGRSTFLLLSENLALMISTFVAALIKLGIADGIFKLHFSVGKALFAALVFQVCLYFYDLYDLNVHASGVELARKLATALLVAALLLGVIYSIFPNLMVIPGIWPLSAVIALVILYSWRVWIEVINRIPGIGSLLLIVGTGELAVSLAREIQAQPTLGIKVCGFLGEETVQADELFVDSQVLGTIDNIDTMAARYSITHIVIALRDRRGRLPVETLLNLKLGGVIIEEGASLYERITGKLPVEELNPSYLVFSSGFRISKLTLVYQRVFSIIFSFVGLVLSMPLLLFIAIAIKLDSRGPIFFQQERVGKYGRIFKLIKFRSMYVDAEAGTGPVWAQADDPRVTRVGRFIRRTRLDELPQFINVLKGDLNFVGPRPERSYFVDQLQTLIPYYTLRHMIKPGLTGWAQVKYPYGATIEEAREKLEYDLYYIKNMSILLDLAIIFHTVKTVLLGRGAR